MGVIIFEFILILFSLVARRKQSNYIIENKIIQYIIAQKVSRRYC